MTPQDESIVVVSAVLDNQGQTDEAVVDLSLDTPMLSGSLRKAEPEFTMRLHGS